MWKCFYLAYKFHWYQDQDSLNFWILGGIPRDIPVGNMGNMVDDVKLPVRGRKEFYAATIHRRGWEKQWRSSAWCVLLGQCHSDTPNPQISHNPLISFSLSFKNNSTPKYLTTRCWYLSLTQTCTSWDTCKSWISTMHDATGGDSKPQQHLQGTTQHMQGSSTTLPSMALQALLREEQLSALFLKMLWWFQGCLCISSISSRKHWIIKAVGQAHMAKIRSGEEIPLIVYTVL